jgi:hypothetical protein
MPILKENELDPFVKANIPNQKMTSRKLKEQEQ